MAVLTICISSCSSKNIPLQEIDSRQDVKIKETPKKTPLDSAQVIQINNRNLKKSILNTSKSKEKKGL
mgnify:CR=1 FL=1|jgi:hypothetical protein